MALQEKILNKRLSLKIDKPKTMNVVFNSIAFMQVLYNVLLNAIESSYLEGEIVVTARIEGSKQQ